MGLKFLAPSIVPFPPLAAFYYIDVTQRSHNTACTSSHCLHPFLKVPGIVHSMVPFPRNFQHWPMPTQGVWNCSEIEGILTKADEKIVPRYHITWTFVVSPDVKRLSPTFLFQFPVVGTSLQVLAWSKSPPTRPFPQLILPNHVPYYPPPLPSPGILRAHQQVTLLPQHPFSHGPPTAIPGPIRRRLLPPISLCSLSAFLSTLVNAFSDSN